MGVSRLPDASEILGPALQQISGALVNYLQPNKAFQKHMQQQLGENPELVLKFADLEAKAPGTLARLGFGNLGDTISQVPETAAGEVSRTAKPQQVAAGKAAIAAQTAEAQVSTEENRAILQVIAQEPTLTYDAARAKLKGQVTKQSLAEMELTTEQRRQSLVKELPDLGKVDFYEEAKKFMTGNLSGQLAASYYSNPETAKPFQDAQAAVQNENMLAQRKVEHLNSKKETATDRIAAKRAQNAYITWQKSGMAGDIDTWEKFMYDPEAQDRAANLLSGKIKPAGYADEQLLEVARAGEKVGVSRFNRDILAINNNITGTIKKLNEGIPDAERPASVAQLNQQLEQRTTLGGPKLRAVWRDIKWGRDRLEFVDEKGNSVDPSKVETMLTQVALKTELSPNAQTALTRITGVTDEGTLMAALARYESSDNSPGKEDSKAVRTELERLGKLKPAK